MTISSALSAAWNDVEQAHRAGHLPNQSMLAFVVSESLRRALPDFQITYDGRVFPQAQSKPNLVIWKHEPISMVHFIGYLKFGDISQRFAREDALELKNAVTQTSFPVLIHDVGDGGYGERQITIAPDCERGLFLVGRSIGEGSLQKLFKVRTAQQRIPFHLGIGVLDEEGLLGASFQYSKPSRSH